MPLATVAPRSPGSASERGAELRTGVDAVEEYLEQHNVRQAVEELQHVKLIVIDEVSRCGAASLEVVEPPPGRESLGRVGVVQMYDFAQLQAVRVAGWQAS